MSFPRAKIQRFNDVSNNVPSPTKYDPKVGDKVKGGCILKCEPKSAFSDTASASSTKSCLTPIFRTPQLPKKHNCLGTGEKGCYSAFKSISLKSEELDFLHQDEELEELRALKVEVSNKTETINDLEKHIQELKNQIAENEKAKKKLEFQIAELENAKSNLECIKDNETCEQISKLQEELSSTKEKIEELTKYKDEIFTKMDEAEKKNNKLEELNLDYERKIISLEGTIEHLEMEQKAKEALLEDLKQKEGAYKLNHQVSFECLHGKISTLENEIKEMDENKSKNEETIFGLETQISSLNCYIEQLKNEKNQAELSLNEVKACMEEMKAACNIHNDTITGLEMELENRIKELQEIKEKNGELKNEMEAIKSEMEKEKASFEEQLKKAVQDHEKEITAINNKFQEEKSQLNVALKDSEVECLALINKHAEEILQLQNDYESKLLAQMQENTEKMSLLQCQLNEKDILFKQSQMKSMKTFAEWEAKLREAENNYSVMVTKLESDHLEIMENVKEDFSKRLRMVEINSSKAIELKNKEIDILTEQYKEILGEVKELLKDLEKKDLELKKVNGSHCNLNSRLKLMLEEIKLLNKENDNKTESLKKMTKKYNMEFSKNEQLSCKLGELDCKISQLKKDLHMKVDDWKRVSEDLKKSKSTSDKINNKKMDLEVTVGDLQDKVKGLLKELKEKKACHEEEIRKANDELGAVKTQCRNFEIVMGNTRKSLEAVRERLIESENEVEKLNGEKKELAKKLKLMEAEKDELKNKYGEMRETKADLEATLDECLSNKKILLEKYNALESVCSGFEKDVQKLKKINHDLETEKQTNIRTMNELVKKQELQLIETERDTLDQVEKVSQILTDKLEFFMKFSAGRIQSLTADIGNLRKEKEEMKQLLKVKSEEFDNLVTDNEILKTTVEITMKEGEDLKKKCEEQASGLVQIQKSLSELSLKQEEAKEKLADEKKKHKELKYELEVLKKEMDQKEEELEKERSLKNKMEKNLTYEKEEHKVRADANENKVKELEQKIKELKIEIREKVLEIESYREEKMVNSKVLQTLSNEKENLLINLGVAETKIKAAEKQSEGLRLEKLKAENDSKKRMAAVEELEEKLLTLKLEKENLEKLSTTIDHVEERKNYYKSNCLKLDKLCSELTEENISLKNDFNQIHSFLQEKDKKVEELEKRCAELESLIGPFREQLEQYENERMLIENDREQLRKQHLEQAAKLGHQNLKQKIQHVVKLKNNLLETRKENEKFQLEIKALKKKIQKLQEELGQDPKRLFIGGKRPATTPFKGKENTSMMTPSTGMLTPMTVKQEPMSPGSPLRNRNQ